jgi:phospholipid/cholesterol/gamma-HCH transport system substrate-binding protein
MENSPNRRAIIVGAFILVGLVFLITGILMIGNLHETFKRKMEVIAYFDDVKGLEKGNNIWFSGVKIGTIKSLHFIGKSKVEVVLNIETKVQQYIRKDAKVKIGTDGLIGNKILVIYDGTEGYAQVEEGDILSVEKQISTEDMMATLQKNNDNILVITTGFKDITSDFKNVSSNFKSISKKLTTKDGTIGKLLNDDVLYDNINTATLSLKNASAKAQLLVGELNNFSAGLNKKGNLANDLINDTIVFNSIKSSVLQLQQIADTANVFIANLKEAGNNPNTSIGVLLHDEEAGAYLKGTIKNLESGSKKLDEDLEAVQHSFLLRRFFKKKAKAAKKILVNQ